MRGLTGLVKFDTSGFRTDFQLDILNVGWNGITKIGTWNSTTNIDWIPENAVIDPNAGLTLRNMTFRVLISLVCRTILEINGSLFFICVLFQFL